MMLCSRFGPSTCRGHGVGAATPAIVRPSEPGPVDGHPRWRRRVSRRGSGNLSALRSLDLPDEQEGRRANSWSRPIRPPRSSSPRSPTTSASLGHPGRVWRGLAGGAYARRHNSRMQGSPSDRERDGTSRSGGRWIRMSVPGTIPSSCSEEHPSPWSPRSAPGADRREPAVQVSTRSSRRSPRLASRESRRLASPGHRLSLVGAGPTGRRPAVTRRRPTWIRSAGWVVVTVLLAGCGGSGSGAPRESQAASLPPALPAGTYTSRAFQPPVTFTLPAGWWIPSDSGDYLGLQPVASDLIGVHLFRDPLAASQDLACPTSAEPGVGALSGELSTWIRGLDGLVVGSPRLATVGGLRGVELDLAITTGWAASCPFANGLPTVPLFVGQNGSFRWVVAGSERLRLSLLDVPRWRYGRRRHRRLRRVAHGYAARRGRADRPELLVRHSISEPGSRLGRASPTPVRATIEAPRLSLPCGPQESTHGRVPPGRVASCRCHDLGCRPSRSLAPSRWPRWRLATN